MSIELQDKLYTSTQVADILGVSLRTLYRYMEDNKIQSMRTASGRHRFTKDQILDFLNATGADVAPSSQGMQSDNLNQNVGSFPQQEFSNQTNQANQNAYTGSQNQNPMQQQGTQLQGSQQSQGNYESDQQSQQQTAQPQGQNTNSQDNSFGPTTFTSNPTQNTNLGTQSDQAFGTQQVDNQANSQQSTDTNIGTDDFAFSPKQEPEIAVSQTQQSTDNSNLESYLEEKTTSADATAPQEAPQAQAPQVDTATQVPPAYQQQEPAQAQPVGGSSFGIPTTSEQETQPVDLSTNMNIRYFRSDYTDLIELAKKIKDSASVRDLEYAFTLYAGVSLHFLIKPFTVLHFYANPEDMQIWKDELRLTAVQKKEDGNVGIIVNTDIVFVPTKEIGGFKVSDDKILLRDLNNINDQELVAKFRQHLSEN